MKLTTLCYLESQGAYLMLHRISKKEDVNAGKWIGVGGKFEAGEAPEDCLQREVFEETGIRINHWDYRGTITFIYDDKEPELIFTYTAELPERSALRDCDEGVLKWIPFEEVMSLELWEGDRYLLRYLLEDRKEPFSLKLTYNASDELLEAAELGCAREVLLKRDRTPRPMSRSSR